VSQNTVTGANRLAQDFDRERGGDRPNPEKKRRKKEKGLKRRTVALNGLHAALSSLSIEIAVDGCIVGIQQTDCTV